MKEATPTTDQLIDRADEKLGTVLTEGWETMTSILENGGIITSRGRVLSRDLQETFGENEIGMIKRERIGVLHPKELNRPDIRPNELVYFVAPGLDKELSFRRSLANPVEVRPCLMESGFASLKFEKLELAFLKHFLHLYQEDDLNLKPSVVSPVLAVRSLLVELAQTVGRGEYTPKSA